MYVGVWKGLLCCRLGTHSFDGHAGPCPSSSMVRAGWWFDRPRYQLSSTLVVVESFSPEIGTHRQYPLRILVDTPHRGIFSCHQQGLHW